MPKEVLDEREFELVNIIGAELGANQRDISRMMELSLGMTNMLIRRLISKGFIRIQQLNQRKVEYILTPKGVSEKTRKSVNYTLKTINSLGLIRNRLREVIKNLDQQGYRKFFILGMSDFAILVEMTLKENGHTFHEVMLISEIPEKELDGVILICREKYKDVAANKHNRFNLIEELASDSELAVKQRLDKESHV
jgi:DNA-binding MarR family transcriptional regulator